MNRSLSRIFQSYLKSTAACFLLALTGLVVFVVGCRGAHGFIAKSLSVAGLLIALIGLTLTSACAVVLCRYSRDRRGVRDLFLQLNRSREPVPIANGRPPSPFAVRRWLSRRLLGHDLIVGDDVEVRSWAEIRATLDAQGCLDGLPFMPEMLAMCGRRARVFRCAHRIFDYRKTRRMRHLNGVVLLVGAVCDGSSHGDCDAACHTIWKADWLRRIPRTKHSVRKPPAALQSNPAIDTGILLTGTQPPRYVCQLTQLNNASRPIGNWSVANFVRPLVAGNVTLLAFVVGWLTHLFNVVQQKRGGVGFPEFETGPPGRQSDDVLPLKPGDRVLVKSPAEIRATLNDQMIHRGLGFEEDMLKHCGHRYFVQSEIRRLVDIVSGELRTMRTPAYILRDVHFSGERQQFNAQYEPLFWRSVWLARESDGD